MFFFFSTFLIPVVMYVGLVIVNGEIPKFEGLTATFFITYPFYFTIGLAILVLIILTVTKGNLGYSQPSHEVGYSNNENIAK